MPKLTDTQLVILSSALRRDGGAVLPLPGSLKVNDDAAKRALQLLLKAKLIAEQSATQSQPVWRTAKDGGRLMLVITDAGCKAIGDSESAAEDQRTATRSVPERKPAPKPAKPTPAKGTKPKAKLVPKIAGKAPVPKSGSKQKLLIDLLKRKSGVTLEEAVKATGWQGHSIRGAISGLLKKKLGLAVVSEKGPRGHIYRIAGGAR